MDSLLKRLREEIISATSGITGEELTRHPEGKWSAGEVLEHLYLSYTGTVKGFARCLDARKPLGGRPTPKQRFQVFVVTGLGYFPSGREAPKVARPKGLPSEQVLNDIAIQITRMDELISQCEAEYGRSVKLLDHPFLGPLTAQQWRKLHWLHGRHHLRQIQRLRENPAAN
ncbi:MAG TPA: DUF1569 domain-containing protein [Terriglobales bacterium]|nr:DUF1569 domain-containing protein [Terriglobales bacterium]